MKCQSCQQPATVHLTDIVDKKKREVHLCEDCARKHDLIPDEQQDLNVPALLQFLVAQSRDEKKKQAIDAEACPHCGQKYAQFRAQGRLGCPADYEVFRTALEPLLERIHRSVRHVGKAPLRVRSRLKASELTELRALLDAAVRGERYEDAAALRDRIRSAESAE